MLYRAKIKDVPVYDPETFNTVEWMNPNDICAFVSSCERSSFISVLFRGKIGSVHISWLEQIEGT